MTIAKFLYKILKAKEAKRNAPRHNLTPPAPVVAPVAEAPMPAVEASRPVARAPRPVQAARRRRATVPAQSPDAAAQNNQSPSPSPAQSSQFPSPAQSLPTPTAIYQSVNAVAPYGQDNGTSAFGQSVAAWTQPGPQLGGVFVPYPAVAAPAYDQTMGAANGYGPSNAAFSSPGAPGQLQNMQYVAPNDLQNAGPGIPAMYQNVPSSVGPVSIGYNNMEQQAPYPPSRAMKRPIECITIDDDDEQIMAGASPNKRARFATPPMSEGMGSSNAPEAAQVRYPTPKSMSPPQHLASSQSASPPMMRPEYAGPPFVGQGQNQPRLDVRQQAERDFLNEQLGNERMAFSERLRTCNQAKLIKESRASLSQEVHRPVKRELLISQAQTLGAAIGQQQMLFALSQVEHRRRLSVQQEEELVQYSHADPEEWARANKALGEYKVSIDQCFAKFTSGKARLDEACRVSHERFSVAVENLNAEDAQVRMQAAQGQQQNTAA